MSRSLLLACTNANESAECLGSVCGPSHGHDNILHELGWVAIAHSPIGIFLSANIDGFKIGRGRRGGFYFAFIRFSRISDPWGLNGVWVDME